MALNPVRPLYSASATATNGSTTVTVTGNVNCSFLSSGSIVSIGTRQLVDAVSGTAPDLSGNSTITLQRAWADPTTTASLLAFMSYEGLADAVVRLRQIIDASEGSLEGAFSFLGAWDPTAGDFPPTPGESLGSQMYRVQPAGTMGGRLYRAGEPIYYDQFTSEWRSFFELASAFTTGLLANSDAATWRTALGLVPTTSPTDTTVGRLLQVGAQGAQLGVDVYKRNNILGTVSQSAGVPTGAVIQRGSNANGEFVRFADGTQICSRVVSYNGTVETAFGSLFISLEIALGSYPAAFSLVQGCQTFVRRSSANAPIWFASGTAAISGGFPNGWINAAVSSTTTLSYTIYQVAYGRWY